MLTGGSSKMEGVLELAEEIFHAPVSLGTPKNVTGLEDIVRNPIHSTGVGLLLYGKQQEESGASRGRRGGGGIVARLRKWLAENF